MLRENVLQNAPSTFDLSTLTVRISKPDGQRWLQLPPQVIDSLSATQGSSASVLELSSSEFQEAKIAQIQKYLDKPLFVTLRLAIEYTLPDVPQATAAAAGPNTNSNAMGSSSSSSSNNNAMASKGK